MSFNKCISLTYIKVYYNSSTAPIHGGLKYAGQTLQQMRKCFDFGTSRFKNGL